MTKLGNKKIRNVKVPCLECKRMLKFRIRNDVIVEGDGVIAVNFPAAICPECTDSMLSQVSDPPGLICIKEMPVTLARELLRSFAFLLPLSEAAKFFASLFPDSGFSNF